MKEKTKRGKGAPEKPSNRRVGDDGLREDQRKWLKEESEIRNLPVKHLVREAVDWYITAKQTKRADVEASKMFDAEYKEVVKNNSSE